MNVDVVSENPEDQQVVIYMSRQEAGQLKITLGSHSSRAKGEKRNIQPVVDTLWDALYEAFRG